MIDKTANANAKAEPNVTWVMGTRKALARSIAVALAGYAEDMTAPLNPEALERVKLKAIVERAKRGPGAEEHELRIAALAMNEGLAYRHCAEWSKLTKHQRDRLYQRALDVVDTMIEVKAMGAFQHPWREPRRGNDDDNDDG